MKRFAMTLFVVLVLGIFCVGISSAIANSQEATQAQLTINGNVTQQAVMLGCNCAAANTFLGDTGATTVLSAAWTPRGNGLDITTMKPCEPMPLTDFKTIANGNNTEKEILSTLTARQLSPTSLSQLAVSTLMTTPPEVTLRDLALAVDMDSGGTSLRI